MSYRTDVVYQYDGTFEGLLCCVFESYAFKELPLAIYADEPEQGLLFDVKWIAADTEKADRVYRSIPKRIGREAQDLVRDGFLTCYPQKELLLLQFLRLGFKDGAAVMNRLTDDTVHALQKAVQGLHRESHLLTGFVRFSVYDKVMVSVIEPKNEVLPLIEPHFCDRYADEAFLIFDKTHRKALVYRPGESVIVPLESLELPEAGNEERLYQSLWQRFYDTIAIKERYNPRCRLSHMPKRFWSQMTEHAASPVATPRLEKDDRVLAEPGTATDFTSPRE